MTKQDENATDKAETPAKPSKDSPSKRGFFSITSPDQIVLMIMLGLFFYLLYFCSGLANYGRP